MLMSDEDTINMHLLLLEWASGPDLERLLIPIGNAIRECEDFMRHLLASGDADQFEAFADDEFTVIEDLLGCAFVICQTSVTSLVSSVKVLNDFEKKHHGITLSTTDASKRGLLQNRSRRMEGSTYTEMETIDAFANYFKHREEWSHWDQLEGQRRVTAEILRAAGADEHGRWHFIAGARALGISNLHELGALWMIVQKWRASVQEQYREELQRYGLV
jgi:hypothetical protein